MSHTAALSHARRKNDSTSVVANASEIGKLPLEWEPGTKYQYSEGPIVGGAIIEVASGMLYADFINQRVLEPLGMKDSTFWPTPEQAATMPICAKYNPATNKLKNVHLNDPIINDPSKYAPVPRRLMLQCNMGMVSNYKNRFARPDADLFCTTPDMAKFGQMLLNNGTYQGRRLLSAAAVKEIRTIQTGNLFPGNEEGYGLCTFIQKNPSDYGPTPGSFGHRGARSTVYWVGSRG